MRLGARLLAAGVSAAAAVAMAAPAATAATTAASGPQKPAATSPATTTATAAAGGKATATPDITAPKWIDYSTYDSEAACELVGSLLMYTVVDGGVVWNYSCIDTGLGWLLELYIVPLSCNALPNGTTAGKANGVPGKIVPDVKC